MNGAAGRRVYGFSSTGADGEVGALEPRRRARARRPRRAAATSCRSSCPSGPKSRPCAIRFPSSWTSRAAKRPGSKVALDVPVRGGRRTPSARARARRRAASPPTGRGRPTAAASPSSRAPARPRSRTAGRGSAASPASRRGDSSTSRGCARAPSSIAPFVISWKTIRRVGHLRLQLLEQVPGDRLALAVLVRREQELVGVLQLALQPGDHLLLVRVDDVVRLELVLDGRRRARRSASGPPSGRRRRASAGHGCDRCWTRRRTRARGTRRSSSPSPGDSTMTSFLGIPARHVSAVVERRRSP